MVVQGIYSLNTVQVRILKHMAIMHLRSTHDEDLLTYQSYQKYNKNTCKLVLNDQLSA